MSERHILTLFECLVNDEGHLKEWYDIEFTSTSKKDRAKIQSQHDFMGNRGTTGRKIVLLTLSSVHSGDNVCLQLPNVDVNIFRCQENCPIEKGYPLTIDDFDEGDRPPAASFTTSISSEANSRADKDRIKIEGNGPYHGVEEGKVRCCRDDFFLRPTKLSVSFSAVQIFVLSAFLVVALSPFTI